MKIIYLIIIGLFWSANCFCQFSEVSETVGIDHEFEDYTQISSGVAIFDMNNDTLLDLYLTGGVSGDKLYLNNGNGFYRVISYFEPEDFDYYDHYSTGVACGDVNNDGFDDLVVCGWRDTPTLLFINKGDGKFDVRPPLESGIKNHDWSTGATFGDINEDGYIDMFLYNYIDTGRVEIDSITGFVTFLHVGSRNALYINQGDETFVESAEAYGITNTGNTLSSTFTNFDRDDDIDLYVINDFGATTQPNELYENAYPMPLLDDVSQTSHADIGLFGMGVAIGDYDGDLDLDYYVTNIGRNVLLQNNGSGVFADVTNEAGVTDSATLDGKAVGWGTGFMDYDNDGDLDLYISNGHINSADQIYNPGYNANALYSNNGDGTFTDMRDALMFNDPSVFRGSAYGDLNMDGMQDVIAIPSNKPLEDPIPGLRENAAVFYNFTTNSNNWIQFKLVGDTSNASGYGALIYLYDESGRVQLRESDGGSSHGSSNSPYIHFGLGSAASVDSVLIIWPHGLEQIVYKPSINMLNVIQEGIHPAIVFTSVQDPVFEQFSIHPNPVSDHLQVRTGDLFNQYPAMDYEVRNIAGSLIDNGKLHQGATTIDLQHLPSGTYVFHISLDDKRKAGRSFVKQ